jgi:hypothetical protein
VAAEYLFRLDDACPTMDSQRWDALLSLLACRGIHPIIAIVPANTDPALANRPADPDFWQRARAWAAAGAMIALHGYSHALRPSGGGLVPVQRYSEFVGLPVDEQRRRIAGGVRILETNGLSPEAWVAPAHGFDLGTLQALRLESDIRIISDGFMRRAVRREAFVWLPQQLWRPRVMTKGLWTICLHPNEIDEGALRSVEAFLSDGPGFFPDPRDAAKNAADYGPADAVFAGAFAAMLKARQWGRRMGRKVE